MVTVSLPDHPPRLSPDGLCLLPCHTGRQRTSTFLPDQGIEQEESLGFYYLKKQLTGTEANIELAWHRSMATDISRLMSDYLKENPPQSKSEIDKEMLPPANKPSGIPFNMSEYIRSLNMR